MKHLSLRVLRVLWLPEENVVKGEHDSGEWHAEYVYDDSEHADAFLITFTLVESIEHHLMARSRAETHGTRARAHTARGIRLARHRPRRPRHKCTAAPSSCQIQVSGTRAYRYAPVLPLRRGRVAGPGHADSVCRLTPLDADCCFIIMAPASDFICLSFNFTLSTRKSIPVPVT